MTGKRGPDTTPPDGLAAVPAWWRWSLVAAYMFAIFLLSSQSTLPALPGRPSDKLVHGVTYGGLSVLIVWAASRGDFRRVTARTVLLAVLASTLYGYSDECHQFFVPGREYDLKDLAADAIGAVAASGAVWAWGIIARGSGRHHGV